MADSDQLQDGRRFLRLQIVHLGFNQQSKISDDLLKTARLEKQPSYLSDAEI